MPHKKHHGKRRDAPTAKQAVAEVVDNPPLYANHSMLTSALDKLGTISILKGSLTTTVIVNLMLILGFYMIPNEIMVLADYPYRNMSAVTSEDLKTRDSMFLGLVIAVAVTGFLAIVLSTIMTINLYRRKSETEARLDMSVSKWGTRGSKFIIIAMSSMMTFILLLTILFNGITIGSKHNTTDLIAEAEFVLGIFNMIMFAVLWGIVGCVIWIISITNRKDMTTLVSDAESGKAPVPPQMPQQSGQAFAQQISGGPVQYSAAAGF